MNKNPTERKTVKFTVFIPERLRDLAVNDCYDVVLQLINPKPRKLLREELYF